MHLRDLVCRFPGMIARQLPEGLQRFHLMTEAVLGHRDASQAKRDIIDLAVYDERLLRSAPNQLESPKITQAHFGCGLERQRAGERCFRRGIVLDLHGVEAQVDPRATGKWVEVRSLLRRGNGLR